ncbi:hypothetical protein CI41S_18240 [Bradyrhizobium ivorense]|nr:hypothetical protein CI41S_18240 [Bradyrhizobium ivorense]
MSCAFLRRYLVPSGFAISAWTRYRATALDPSQFEIFAMPKPDVELGQLECAIDEVAANIAHNSPQAEDLERVKTQLIARAIYAHDNPEELATWYGGGLTTGLSIDDVRGWSDGIRAVRAEQQNNCAHNSRTSGAIAH